MLVFTPVIALAASVGTVRLHLTDAHNRPIPHHQVWLTATNSTKPVRPFGVQWWIPDAADSFHGTTDKNGDVAIPRVPVRKPMMVVVKFGPRFDAFVGKDEPDRETVDVMKFEGAVYAGKRAHIVLADDYEITGTATDAAGKPLPNVKVYLTDTGFGHMGGYPGTTLDEQTTDASGVYHFKKLPNCAFLMSVEASTHMAIQSRPGKGAWQFLAIVGQESSSASVVLTGAKEICDFRIVPTANLTVKFKGTSGELKGWTAWFESDSVKTTGQSIDFNPSYSTMTRDLLPGLVTVWLERHDGDNWIVAKKLTLKPGEKREIEISVADVVKKKRGG